MEFLYKRSFDSLTGLNKFIIASYNTQITGKGDDALHTERNQWNMVSTVSTECKRKSIFSSFALVSKLIESRMKREVTQWVTIEMTEN